MISARPTFSLGGRDTPELAGRLVSMRIVDGILGLARCEARFGNWGNIRGKIDFLYFDRQTLDFGKDFRVSFGGQTLFDGRITGMEGLFHENRPPELDVLAEDRFQDLRMTRRTRSFHDLTDSDLAKTIASDHALTPEIDVHGPSQKVIAQVNQSDLAFLRERMRSLDAEVWVEGKTLHAKAHSSRGDKTTALTYRNELRAASVLADLAGQRTGLTVGGWDVAAKAAITEKADDSVLGNELNGGLSGASILRKALGARVEALAHTVPLDSATAHAEAESSFKGQARQFVTARGVAEPDGKIRVGTFVDLKGIGPLFNGKYYVREVRHVFDDSDGQGFRTEFTAERPGLGKP